MQHHFPSDVLISEGGPRGLLQAGLPGEPVYGMTPEAGLPKGFVQGTVNV